jgi:hypothetical protein
MKQRRKHRLRWAALAALFFAPLLNLAWERWRVPTHGWAEMWKVSRAGES